MANNKKNILIDGRFIGIGESISRYTLEILKGILTLDHKNNYTILIRPKGKSELKAIQQLNNLTIDVLDIPHYSLSEQTQLLKWLNKKKFDLIHFTQFNHPINYKGKFVVTVHDLTLLGHLHRMNIVKRLGFRRVMASAIKNSAAVISVSNTTKKDIIETYKIKGDKINVTHLGVDGKYNSKVKSCPSRPRLEPRSEKSKIISFKNKYRITGDYILYTGMWKRHKNLKRMLEAFEQVKKQVTSNNNQTNSKSQITNIQLVLVGKIDKEEPEVIKLINEINERIMNDEVPMPESGSRHKIVGTNLANQAIIATGFIDEEELPLAYAGALAYCIPSLSEGFGLPPLEAMACGTPVISSNISAMPEILGDAPLYFDPYDVEDIAKAMKKIIEDKNLRDQLSQKGLERVKRYNWNDTAKRTLEVYKEILFEQIEN